MNINKLNQWPEVKSTIANHANLLAQELDAAFTKNPNLNVFQVQYSYGDFILKDGTFINELPGGHKPAFALILNGGTEVFTEKENKQNQVATIAMLKPGNMLFLQQNPEPCIFPTSIQNVTAGARSIFLLPKVGNSERFWRMARRHKIPMDLPTCLLDQWRVFKTLAASHQSPWNTELIIFTEEWLQQENSEAIKQCLRNQIIPTPLFNSHKQEIDEIVDQLIEERAELYSGQILKNILAIAKGDLPGFAMAEDELFAPINLIQKAFIEDYGLKSAELIQPEYVKPESECFYSFELHNNNTQGFIKKPYQPSLDVLEDTQRLYTKLLESDNQHLQSYLKARLEFFHAFANGEQPQNNSSNGRKLSPYAPFIRKGCISIAA